MKLLNGSDLAGFIKERQAKQVRGLRQAYGILPRLAIITNATNPVIDVYMRLKQQYGADILVDVEIHRVAPDETLAKIDELNARDDVQAVIVQLPLADMSQADEVLGRVAPEKDVDGLNPNGSTFDAATPLAINWLLAGYSVELVGKRLAIIGRGRLVGKPLEWMWRNSGLEPTVFEKGDDLSELKHYDVIVTATGDPGIITSDMVRPSAVVVDAGTASENGKIVGDVADDVRQRPDIVITPQKGGVGPLTVAALFDNVVTACLRIANQRQ